MSSRIITAAVLALLLATPAFAHAFLQHASPGAGEAVTSPKEIALTFSEKLEPNLSGASVTDAGGYDIGKVSVTDSTITVALPPLKPGAYHVAWHAVSVDTHRTEGNYSFTIHP